MSDGEKVEAVPILRLQLLGSMAVQGATGKSLLPRARKTRALLAILALAAPRPVLRLHLAALLWSQREKEQARASLRQAVHDLNETLGSPYASLIRAERNHVAFADRGLQVDILDLSRDAGKAKDLVEQFCRVALEDLDGLDPAFDRWLDHERQRLTRIARTTGESLLSESRGATNILQSANRLLLIDPAHEAAWRAVIRVHAERGDRGAAIAAFERCRAALAEASFLMPDRETQELVASIRHQTIGEKTRIADAREVPAASRPSSMRPASSGIRLGIMPFRSIDPNGLDCLTQGLESEIITGLARYRGISCVPIGAADFLLEGRSILDLLDIDYLVEATIQHGAGRVRIMARLIDVRANGEVIWADRFDRELIDSLASQSEIASEIVAQIDPRLMLRQGERAAAQRADYPTPNELVLQSIPAIFRLERRDFQAAGKSLKIAVTEGPDNAPAHAWLAYWNLFLVGQGWTTEPDAVSAYADELAKRAIALDPGDARALTLAGHVRGYLGKRPDEACTLHRRAITLNPNLALAWCFFGLAQCYRGNHEEALRLIGEAMRLSPFDPHLFFFDMALTMPHLLLGNYEAVVEISQRAIQLNPAFTSSYKGHLSALGHLGRKAEAARICSNLLVLEPGFTLRQARTRSPISSAADLDRYVEGLGRAGVPQ